MSNDLEGRTPTYDERTPLLVVGGGLVGLSAAVFLAWRAAAAGETPERSLEHALSRLLSREPASSTRR